MWDVFPHGCGMCSHVDAGCVPSGYGMYSHMDVGCISTWVWDVFPCGCGMCFHEDMSMLPPTFPMCGIGVGRARPVITFLVLLSPDRTELQRAMEHNSRLDKEILALRARVQTLDLERKAFLELVRIHQAKPTILGWLLEVIPAPKPALPFPFPSLFYAQSFQSCSLAVLWFMGQ